LPTNHPSINFKRNKKRKL